jgi:hypothetical protein
MTDPHHPDGAVVPQGEVRPASAVGHEETDADLRSIVWFGVVLAAAVAVVLALLVALFFAFKGEQDRDKRSRFPLSAPERARLPQSEFGSPATGVLPPSPQLEGLDLHDPDHDVGRRHSQGTARLKTQTEDEQLNGSGPVEGKPGAVHIPIEQAMRLVAEESGPQGREPAPVRYDQGIPGTGGGSDSGRNLPEARR